MNSVPIGFSDLLNLRSSNNNGKYVVRAKVANDKLFFPLSELHSNSVRCSLGGKKWATHGGKLRMFVVVLFRERETARVEIIGTTAIVDTVEFIFTLPEIVARS